MGNITISVDVMGGANAPKSVIDGLEIACQKAENTDFLLFAYGNDVKKLVENTQHLKNRAQIIDCASVISDDEQPVRALKSGKESTMWKAIEAVKTGKASACISSGNTGALMVMAKMSLGMLKNIKRPAIVSVYPNIRQGTVMLDLGANAECDASVLSQFAVMGVCFAKSVKGLDNPSVGLLNVGSEEYKGRELDKKAHNMLKSSKMNYVGFIEAHDLAEGTVDVCVTDGFTGNVALKASEGIAKVCMEYMKRGFRYSIFSKIGALLAKTGLKKSFQMIDPRNYNGAMFIGVDGIVIKSHGSCDDIGFSNAVKVAINLSRSKINREIGRMIELEQLEEENLVSRIKQKLGF